MDLRDDVLAEIEWEPSVDEASIGVAAHNGVVTLSGQVSSYYEKSQLMAAVKRVDGVAAIADEITIESKLQFKPTDTDIARAVHAALEANAAIPAEHVRAVVDDGRVTLEGDVDWQYQRLAAQSTAEHARGVRSVINLIHLPEPPVRPVDVKAKIEAAFRRRADIDASRITVRVDAGTVVLEGAVPAAYERDAAEAAAWGAKGIRAVDDRIRIDPKLR
jgi:osmotically-inducible protein OsmY